MLKLQRFRWNHRYHFSLAPWLHSPVQGKFPPSLGFSGENSGFLQLGPVNLFSYYLATLGAEDAQHQTQGQGNYNPDTILPPGAKGRGQATENHGGLAQDSVGAPDHMDHTEKGHRGGKGFSP